MPVILEVTREENGVVKTTLQKIVFKANSAEAGFMVKPSRRATGPSWITVRLLLETGTFHAGPSIWTTIGLER
jgi:hypothetical protein